MRKLALPAALAVLAGCLAAPAPAPEAVEGAAVPDLPDLGLLPDGTPVPARLAFEDCRAVGAFLPFPREAFEALVPEGFRPVPFGGVEALATELVAAHTCAGGDDMLAVLPVEPPAELAREGADAHYVFLGGFYDREDVAATVAAWGAGDLARPGAVELAFPAETPLARLARATAVSDPFAVRLAVTTEGPIETLPGGPLRVFLVRERAVAAVVDGEASPTEAALRGQAALEAEGFPGLPVLAEAGTGVLAGPYDFAWALASAPSSG